MLWAEGSTALGRKGQNSKTHKMDQAKLAARACARTPGQHLNSWSLLRVVPEPRQQWCCLKFMSFCLRGPERAKAIDFLLRAQHSNSSLRVTLPARPAGRPALVRLRCCLGPILIKVVVVVAQQSCFRNMFGRKNQPPSQDSNSELQLITGSSSRSCSSIRGATFLWPDKDSLAFCGHPRNSLCSRICNWKKYKTCISRSDTCFVNFVSFPFTFVNFIQLSGTRTHFARMSKNSHSFRQLFLNLRILRSKVVAT